MESNGKELNAKELRELSDEEFDKLIEKKYGMEWEPSMFSDDELLNNEFWHRVSQSE